MLLGGRRGLFRSSPSGRRGLRGIRGRRGLLRVLHRCLYMVIDDNFQAFFDCAFHHYISIWLSRSSGSIEGLVDPVDLAVVTRPLSFNNEAYFANFEHREIRG